MQFNSLAIYLSYIELNCDKRAKFSSLLLYVIFVNSLLFLVIFVIHYLCPLFSSFSLIQSHRFFVYNNFLYFLILNSQRKGALAQCSIKWSWTVPVALEIWPNSSCLRTKGGLAPNGPDPRARAAWRGLCVAPTCCLDDLVFPPPSREGDVHYSCFITT